MVGGDQGGFIANIRNISTCEAWSEGGKILLQGILAEALVQLERTQVDPEDRRPAFDVWGANVNLMVEAARPHQGWVKDVRAVGAGQHNDIRGRAESWTREKQVSPSRTRPAAVSSPLHTWPPLSGTTALPGSCHRQETVALAVT